MEEKRILGWEETAHSKGLIKFTDFCFRYRLAVTITLAIITAIFAVFALRVPLKTVFEELLPTKHLYVIVNERFKKTFGGSNIVNIIVEAEKGDIFNRDVLTKVQQITNELVFVKAVNPYQIISLASKKLRDIRGSTEEILSVPIMWPEIPKNKEEMTKLRDAILANELIYGRYVSRDLKSTLITVDFYDHLLDYNTAFKQIMAIADKAKGGGVKVGVVGEPILYGWVNHYLPETITIFFITIGAVALVLLLLMRTWRGLFFPMMAGLLCAIWAFGIAGMAGFHLDPLTVVLGFLITARCISHSVQFVARFDYEVAEGAEPHVAARTAMLGLIKPGLLGVATDAAGILVVILTPIPLLQKVAIIGGVWVGTIAICGIVQIPVLLSWSRRPRKYAHPIDIAPILRKILSVPIRIITTRWRYPVVIGFLVIFVVSGIYAFKLKVGDTRPGSPILWSDSQYNLDAAAVNKNFEGSDRMFVVIASEKYDAMREPVILDYMDYFQNFMEAQPEVGGSLSLADALPKIRTLLREGNPRYKEYGADVPENSELVYIYLAGTEPGDIDRYVDPQFENAAVTFMIKDHKGDTIRTAIARVKEFAAKHPIPGADYLLAGGLIGVLGAVNEVILAGQLESIALALLAVVIVSYVGYRSVMAGMFFMIPVIISNTVTFAFMAWRDIGISINTLPVAATGIGLGVDYAFYICDGIREELRRGHDLMGAITNSISSAGRGVLITLITLITCIALWMFSSLRFQAEMGVLIGLWLAISGLTALFLMPALIWIFRPEFIVGEANNKQKIES
ncbi:MAG: MMPL family transporter [Syntrophales bacterium]|nr:MMPL family transporter [Syntrophales bacterium]